MQPRQTVSEIFSTFVQFEGNYFKRWVADPRLRRNMLQCLERSPDASESVWAIYWYRLWQTQTENKATPHLTAYLQESCYWAAKRTLDRFTNVNYELPDYFQMAIAETPNVLKSYSPDRGASLKTFAALVFPTLLKDLLRQRREADRCTPWGLLRKTSKKRWLESLQHAGVSAQTLAQYELAWICFKQLYVPSTLDGKLPEPNIAFWEALANLYNTEARSQLNTFDHASSKASDDASGNVSYKASATTIEQWLLKGEAWVRAYVYPAVISLNAPYAGQESGEMQDTLSDPEAETLLSEMIAQEENQYREEQRSQVQQVLINALEKLDTQSQDILQLYYQQGLTQQQMMQTLQMSQATVSRRLTKARETLLKTLVQWSAEELNNSLNSNLIKNMSLALEEWLRTQYEENTRDGEV